MCVFVQCSIRASLHAVPQEGVQPPVLCNPRPGRLQLVVVVEDGGQSVGQATKTIMGCSTYIVSARVLKSRLYFSVPVVGTTRRIHGGRATQEEAK